MWLIDADGLPFRHELLIGRGYVKIVLYRDIENADTITPESLVRHGRWIERAKEKGQVYCSECATIEKSTDSNYKSRCCPHCGSVMDLEADHGEA